MGDSGKYILATDAHNFYLILFDMHNICMVFVCVWGYQRTHNIVSFV